MVPVLARTGGFVATIIGSRADALGLRRIAVPDDQIVGAIVPGFVLNITAIRFNLLNALRWNRLVCTQDPRYD